MKPINIEFRNPYSVKPPGTSCYILSHPSEENGVVELSVFQEHRYAFFYWLKWTKELKTVKPPCLISLDWHQDLCSPSELECKELAGLDQTNDGEVAAFCWARMAGNNDGHILSAAYLNLIGNIYVHCRQDFFGDWEDEELIDMYGNQHRILKFKTYEELEIHLLSTTETNVYFDIDLDFFALEDAYHNFKKGNYLTNREIKEMLSFERPLTKWIFDRLCGFTIATEPEHTGGLVQSNKLLSLINSIYFDPSLGVWGCKWKHKSEGLKAE